MYWEVKKNFEKFISEKKENKIRKQKNLSTTNSFSHEKNINYN